MKSRNTSHPVLKHPVLKHPVLKHPVLKIGEKSGPSFGVAGVLTAVFLLALSPAWASQDQETSSAESSAESSSVEAPWQAKNPRTVMKALRYVDGQSLLSVVSLLEVAVQWAREENVLILRGESDQIETALKIVDQLDRPAAGVALKAYVLWGSKDGEEEVDVPPSASKAAEQLKEIFGYSRIQWVDTLYVRATNLSEISLEGGMDAEILGQPRKLSYGFAVDKTRVIRGEDGLSVKLEGLTFQTRLDNDRAKQARMQTDVELVEGQSVVVGKAGPQGTDEAVILVMEVDVDD